ncbi:hypothetical protein Droror1_Dr00010241 [Drosera rotundifolia]
MRPLEKREIEMLQGFGYEAWGFVAWKMVWDFVSFPSGEVSSRVNTPTQATVISPQPSLAAFPSNLATTSSCSKGSSSLPDCDTELGGLGLQGFHTRRECDGIDLAQSLFTSGGREHDVVVVLGSMVCDVVDASSVAAVVLGRRQQLQICGCDACALVVSSGVQWFGAWKVCGE